MTQAERARLQPMADANPGIEDEAFALPQAFCRGYRFEIFEDAALQMIDLVQALGLEEGGGLFAANAAGAEHRDLGRRVPLQRMGAEQPRALITKPRRKIAKRPGLRIDRTGKAAH